MPTVATAPPRNPIRDLAKYTAHGLAFAGLFLFVGLAWAALFLVLVICGLFIGLAIGLVLYFVLMGYVNAFVTESLWFRVRTGLLACLGHGFLLFLALLPLNLVVVGVRYFVTPDLLVSLLIFVLTAPIAGVIAKKVAGMWRIMPSEITLGPPAEPPAAPAPPPFDYARK